MTKPNFKSNYSDQSQQEQTACSTNQGSYQLPVTCSKQAIKHTYMYKVQFNKLTSVFHASVLLLIMNFVITLSK